MSVASILAPVFVQVALCFMLLLGLIGTRALSQRDSAWQVRAGRVGASYANQFEMPVLFFGWCRWR